MMLNEFQLVLLSQIKVWTSIFKFHFNLLALCDKEKIAIFYHQEVKNVIKFQRTCLEVLSNKLDSLLMVPALHFLERENET